MTTAEKARRGTKRVCPQCEARFYDLLRASIPCPACGAEYIVAAAAAQGLAPPPPPHKSYGFAKGWRGKPYSGSEPVRQAELTTASNIPIYNGPEESVAPEEPEESVAPERDNDAVLMEHEPDEEDELSSLVDHDGNTENEH